MYLVIGEKFVNSPEKLERDASDCSITANSLQPHKLKLVSTATKLGLKLCVL